MIGTQHAPAALLSVRDLRVRTGLGRILVSGTTFDLRAGEVLGIVGESGSGKTLTARAVVRGLADGVVADGDVTFDGIPLLETKERELRAHRGSRIAMVLQDPFTALNPLQSVREHLRESLRPEIRKNRAEARSEVARRLAEVGLGPEVADRYPFQLSGGMRQRVAIAAALAQDPELLVADEPTTALDATTQAQVLELLRTLQRDRGMALILITHDLRVAFSVCDRIMVMYAGSVLEHAPTGRMVQRPLHPYSLGLMLAEPSVTHFQKQLNSVPGNVPSADSVAHTCVFADRCQWRQEECTTAAPPLVGVESSHGAAVHLSACIRVDDLRDEMRAALSSRAGLDDEPPRPELGTSLLKVTGVSKTFKTASLAGRRKENVALQEVSFEVARGESLGLLGETGSGKTTTARCVLGLSTPTSGRIELDEFDISDYRRLSRDQRAQVRRRVQVVFQDPYASLNPSMTVGRALGEAIAAGGPAAAGASGSVAELLDLVGLPQPYAARRPGALSGGERQRVAIARALAVHPKLLICDEPVAALDVSVQAQILELLRDVRERYGTSMLFITHDLSVVRQMTDRTIVLKDGVIVEAGTTADLLDSPQHPYTQSLVASVPGAGALRARTAPGGLTA
ncbi:ABC transporter ATP-binding protein [Streptomyces sp. NBC_01445]|uniref:ABC transporter ATP-binding protein n=1 Tax=Streptomyces sp. NBC_01445 TaxID=2903869 RepID=UPI002DD8CC22|nr:ABC transporter ATP-binding protein [Streptomyces sp. NBC_01445]WSE11262.1 ABC transporter ATP-binding protein [Streptomyces sp. NBC_01445]